MSVGDELWAWQVQEPSGGWSLVGAMIGDPDTGEGMHTPLIHRNQEVVEKFMEPLARSHAEATGQKLRLAHFILVPRDISAGQE